MNPKIEKLAKKAGFIFWQNESWGPGPGNIDWGCDYSAEFKKFIELLELELTGERRLSIESVQDKSTT